jgi:hypothetical protein
MIYVPVLRGKLGEFRGIKSLTPEIKSQVRPLIRVTDPDLDYDFDPAEWKMSHADHFSKIAGYIKKFFESDIVAFIDFESDPAIKVRGLHYSSHMFKELNSLGVEYIPVVGIDRKDENGYLESIKSFGLALGDHLCIRIPKDYVESITLHLGDIEDLITDLSFEGELTLILDIEKVENVASAKKTLEIAISALMKKVEFKNLVISAACMPETMSDFDTNETTSQRRLEWDLWKSLKAKYPIVYSDYGVLSTSTQSINPKTMTRSCRIRYSNENEIVVFKGESDKKTKSRVQNPQLASQVLEHECYKGSSYSWGDEYIDKCATGAGGPGNATTWISAEMNHHITLVCEQVSNYYDL